MGSIVSQDLYLEWSEMDVVADKKCQNSKLSSVTEQLIDQNKVIKFLHVPYILQNYGNSSNPPFL